MFTVQTEQSFDAAHFLADYQGKCKNIHGHRWRVIMKVNKEDLEKDGMVVDFSKLKEDLKQEVDYFDHTLIIEKDSLKPATYQALLEEDFRIIQTDFRPTAENFSRFFYEQFKKLGYLVKSSVVYETPNNCAEYREG